MKFIFLYILGGIGFFGWGMYTQEMIQKLGQIKARQSRIIIDAPFSPEQSETIMNALKEINEAVNKSMKQQEANDGE